MVLGIRAEDDVLRYRSEDGVSLRERQLRAKRFIEFIPPGDDVAPVDRRLGATLGESR